MAGYSSDAFEHTGGACDPAASIPSAPPAPDLGAAIALASAATSPAALYADPLVHIRRVTEAGIRLLRSAGYTGRTVETLEEWLIENTPADELAAVSARLGITIAETA